MKCQFCDSEVRPYHKTALNAYYRCERCNIVQELPQVPSPPVTDESMKEWGMDDIEVYKATMDNDFNLLKKYAPSSGRVLDFGCCTGPAIERFIELGYSVVGYEPAVKCAAIACARGRKVVTKFENVKASFDIVFCREVLEHLENPFAEFIDVIASRLKVGGCLYVQTPTPDKLSGTCTFGVSHHNLFPLETTVKLFKERGLTPVYEFESPEGCTIAIFKNI